MRIGIIVNPRAGKRSTMRLRARIEDFAHRSGAEMTFRVQDRLSRIESITREMVTDVDMLGVVGGDGSLNGVVNGVMTSDRRDIPVFFVPVGRGKDAARTLPSWDMRTIDRSSMSYRLREVDLGLVQLASGEHRYFVNETSIGIGAFAARSASHLPRFLGTTSYLIGTAHGLLRERPTTARLNVDQTGFVELPRCHHITISNGRYFGGGLQISPKADATDGLLDIIAVADVGAFEIAKAMPQLFRATHLSHPKVHHWQAASLQVETSKEALIESDGEQWATTPIQVTVQPGALTWLEPA